MRNPFLAGVAASAGTFVVMGGATFVVSGVALSVAKRVISHRKLKAAATCTACQGEGYVRCNICMGRGILRCRAPRTLRSLGRKPQAKPEQGGGSACCVCPGCGTTLKQRCLNCLGGGRVCLPQ